MQTSFTAKLLLKLFPNAIENIETAAVSKAVTHERDRVRYEREKSVLYQARSWVGEKVVVFGNEWEDPIFGTVTAVYVDGPGDKNAAVGSMVTLKDALTGEFQIAFTTALLMADAKMIEAVLKLNPFERWNMSVKTRKNMWSKRYPLGPITKSSELARKLQEIGFYTPTA